MNRWPHGARCLHSEAAGEMVTVDAAHPWAPSESYFRKGVMQCHGDASAQERNFLSSVVGYASSCERWRKHLESGLRPLHCLTVAEQFTNGIGVSVNIEASIPKLAKQARLQAIRHFNASGNPEYQVLHVEGDSTVKKQVIARYLSAEAQARIHLLPLLRFLR